MSIKRPTHNTIVIATVHPAGKQHEAIRDISAFMHKHLPGMVYHHLDTAATNTPARTDRTRVFAGVPGEKKDVRQVAEAIEGTCGCYTEVLENETGERILMIRPDKPPVSADIDSMFITNHWHPTRTRCPSKPACLRCL